jgi:hypothetical protein
MKTIVLFHRLDLTDLYVSLGKILEPRVRVVHLAYSEKEVARLRELNVSGPITVFTDEVRRLYPSSVVDQTKLEEIDGLFIRASHGAFNLNGAIQSDRGFRHLSLDEAQQLTFTYYRFWTEFLERHDANLVLHETCSLMFNFVASMLCSARGGHYLYTIMVQGPGAGFYHLTMSGFEFDCMDLNRALEALGSGSLQVDEAKCAAFLTEFRKDASIFLGGSFKKPLLARLAAVALYKWARRTLRSNPYDRVLENIDYWEFGENMAAEKLRNLRAYRRRVIFDDFDATQPYFFYPIHLEPEAVVLYHAHGLYTNQVKLMQNIAAQLPPGVFLYVKDHPHDQGYRSVEDYLVLKSIPNIRLLESHLPAKKIVAHSLGVITLTGTAGFEALLLGKRVFTFGKTYYSEGPGVVYLRNIRDLREAIYRSLARPEITEAELYRYLTAYFAALRPGLVDYFAGRAQRYGIDLEKNAEDVANGLLATLQGQE